MLEYITKHFSDSIEVQLQALDQLSPIIIQAAELMVCCIANDKKILTCGHGNSAYNAQYFTSLLVNQFVLDRPGLPAITLSSEAAPLMAITDVCSYDEIFAKQIRALGQPDDVLLLLSNGHSKSNMKQGIQAAHDREMSVIALSSVDEPDVYNVLNSDDIELRIPSCSSIRIYEMQTLIIHCLCDFIDQFLFGEI